MIRSVMRLTCAASLLTMFAGSYTPLLAAETPPPSAEFVLTLTATDQAQWPAVAGVVDQCVAAASLHGDVKVCQQLSAFLAAFADRVAKAPPVAIKPTDTPQ